MLVLPGTTHKSYLPDKALLRNVCTVRQFQDRLGLGPAGRGYLRSIIEADSSHIYASLRDLGLTLKIRDNQLRAAITVVQKVEFQSPIQLDDRYWQQQKSQENWDCKTPEYAYAIDELLKNPLDKVSQEPKNNLECHGMAQLAVLIALKMTVGNDKFNALLRRKLTSVNKTRSTDERIKFSLRMDSALLQKENLINDTPTGDWKFRPGDLVNFANHMPETQTNDHSRVWQAENAVCVGWKADRNGEPNLDEPVFVGAGLPFTGTPPVLTEGEMKEAIFVETMKAVYPQGADPAQRDWPPYATSVERMRYFSEKALEIARAGAAAGNKRPAAPPNIPDIELLTYVERIAYLGGRIDLP